MRWSRELPSEPSSVTIIREPDGHYYASFVVDVAATPLPAVQREAGVDVGMARLATVANTDGARIDVANPKHLGRKLRKLRRLEREKSRRQKGSINRDKARRKVAIAHSAGGAGSEGLSPQAGFGVGSREPSDPRRRPQHCGHGQEPPARSRDQGCRVGSVRADHRREGRPLWAHPAHGVAMAGVEQDLLGVRAPARRTAAARAPVGMPDVLGVAHDRDHNAAKVILAAGRAERLNDCGARVRPQPVGAVGDEAGSTPTAA